jgi:hypothetical protein
VLIKQALSSAILITDFLGLFFFVYHPIVFFIPTQTKFVMKQEETNIRLDEDYNATKNF